MANNNQKGKRGFVTTHGLSRTKLYCRWRSIKDRVSPTWHQAKRYYDRGIRMCDEWRNFETFALWALDNGYEEHLELDRKDNDKGYYPDNCRYITRRENSLNTSKTIFVEYEGESIALGLLCDKLGFTYKQMNTIRTRLKRGWSLDRSINYPFRK